MTTDPVLAELVAMNIAGDIEEVIEVLAPVVGYYRADRDAVRHAAIELAKIATGIRTATEVTA